MKVRVLQTFHDKDCYSTIYTEGKEYEFESTRAKYLVSLKLAELIQAEKPKTETTDVVEVEAEATDAVNANEAEAKVEAEAPKRGRKPKAE